LAFFEDSPRQRQSGSAARTSHLPALVVRKRIEDTECTGRDPDGEPRKRRPCAPPFYEHDAAIIVIDSTVAVAMPPIMSPSTVLRLSTIPLKPHRQPKQPIGMRHGLGLEGAPALFGGILALLQHALRRPPSYASPMSEAGRLIPHAISGQADASQLR